MSAGPPIRAAVSPNRIVMKRDALPLLVPLLLLGALLASPPPAGAQDVEMLGREYGTRPPPAYYETLARDPDAFTFQRGWKGRLGGRLPGGEDPDPGGEPGGGGEEPEGGRRFQTAEAFQPGVAATLGPREGTVEGEIAFPVVLGRFQDTDSVAFDSARVQREFFDGPNSRFKTIPDYYAEVSGGRVQLEGATHDWATSSLTREDVAGGTSGLGGGSRVGEYIVQLLVELDDRGVDWGRFDNDGPDGVPNSGDDDGYVDVLAVIHPTRGAECGGAGGDDRIWSHRWTIAQAWSGTTNENDRPYGYVTSIASNSTAHNIRVNDYTIQPLLSCDGRTINEIGVMAHELGHGFGLPDLYCTASSCSHTGAGNWALMATGTWGCRGGNPSHPCHMSAWSKSVLGWVDVVELGRGRDLGTLSLPPVETSGAVHRVEAGDGSGEYFLLENRQVQPDGFDEELYEPGVLIWHVDPAVLEESWPSNTINNDPTRMGVWLRQADGLDELGAGAVGRGDGGDPFPGASGQDAFHAGTSPAAYTHGGEAAGVTFLDIGPGSGQEMMYRAVTRYQEIRLAVEGIEPTEPLFTVDGATRSSPEAVVRSAPFEEHLFEAAPGHPVEDGIRIAFQGWKDGAPRIRDHTTGLEDETLVASYDGRQVRFDVPMESPVSGVTPGSVLLEPGTDDGWAPEGADVAVTAEPRTGFGFVAWSGELEGSPNPTVVTADGPLSATARFEKTFTSSAPSSVEVRAAVAHEIVLEAAHANEPVRWSLVEGTLPPGLSLDPEGLITGAPLEEGAYPLTLEARDAIGLVATATVTLGVREPGFSATTLTAPFLILNAVPDEHQRAYLDRHGNRNGRYDLGDLRAYVLATPELAASGTLPGPIRMLVPAVDMEAAPDSADGGGSP